MKNYHDLIELILLEGERRKTRNGYTLGTFDHSLFWDLQEGFPILTSKEMKLKSIASELAWILEGSNDDYRLRQLNGTERTIWTDNAEAFQWQASGHCKFPGDVGKIYGPLLRDFHGVDQLRRIVDLLQDNPMDRRMVVTMWDPSASDEQCLPTCHYSWQVYVRDGTFLDLKWIQRSVDVGLGLPYDIVHYAIYCALLAQTVGLQPGILSCSLGDTHIYEEHAEALREQAKRHCFDQPKLVLDPDATVFNFMPEMVSLEGYKAHPPVKLEFKV